MTSAKLHKQLPRLFPFKSFDDDDDLGVFCKFRTVGDSIPDRTKSASPRAPAFQSTFSSMPDLKQFADRCSLVDIGDVEDDDVKKDAASLRSAESTVVNDSVHQYRSPLFSAKNGHSGLRRTMAPHSSAVNLNDSNLDPMPSPDSVAQEIFFVVPSSSKHSQSAAEAPARLNSPTREINNRRAHRNLKPRSNSIACGELLSAFCSLETSREEIMRSDLPALVQSADAGLKAGVHPVIAEDAMGGCYFMRDKSRSIQLVFKPSDEEPNAPNNPQRDGSYGCAYKGRIVPGFGMYREVAAYTIDFDNFAGVPPTDICKVRSPVLHDTNQVGPFGYKIGSIQSYVRSECSAEEMGSAKFDVGDVMRMAVLDIRICNLDRHAGNILVSRSAPYQHPRIYYMDDNSVPIMKTESSSAPASFECGSHMPVIEDAFHQQAPSSSPTSSSPYRLIPIDHGFSFPHILNLSDATFSWLYWSQVREPLTPEVKAYIENLDAEKDCAKIRKLVGTAIPETSLLSLKLCTKLLKYGVEKGLSLFEIGMLMVAGVEDDEEVPSDMSKLQFYINKAIRTVITNDLAEKARRQYVSPRRSPDLVVNFPSGCDVTDEMLSVALMINEGEALLTEFDKCIEDLVHSRCD